MATYIDSNGTEWDIDGRLTLESVQVLVGGYAEHVPLPDGRHLFVDEDGKLKNKPKNASACALFGPYGHIVGDVLILDDREYRELAVYRFPENRR